MKAIITVGPPASGKSDWARWIVSTCDNVTEINLDDCRKTISGDESNQACTAEAVALRDRLIDECQTDLIVSDTNLDPKFRDQLISKLKARGYSVYLMPFHCALDTLHSRNNQRAKKVPAHVIDRMHSSFALQFHRAPNLIRV